MTMPKDTQHNNNGYVRWSVMSILLTILILVLGVMWTEIKSEREAGVKSREDIAQVKADVSWIKGLIQKGEVSILRK